MRARCYSPELRRFINADILHGGISDSTSLNRYAYVNGNPVLFVDPLGLESENLYIKNKELIIKALNQTAKSIERQFSERHYRYDEIAKKYATASKKITNELNNKAQFPLDLPEGIQVTIEVDHSYNTSWHELYDELLGFIPIIDILHMDTEIHSREETSENAWLEYLLAIFTKDEIADLTSVSKELKLLSKASTLVSLYEFKETIDNFFDTSKKSTFVKVHVLMPKLMSYTYYAIVDENLLFDEEYIFSITDAPKGDGAQIYIKK